MTALRVMTVSWRNRAVAARRTGAAPASSGGSTSRPRSPLDFGGGSGMTRRLAGRGPRIDAEAGEVVAPSGFQGRAGRHVGLGAAGGEGGHLFASRGAGRAVAAETLDEGGRALGQVVDHLLGHAGDLELTLPGGAQPETEVRRRCARPGRRDTPIQFLVAIYRDHSAPACGSDHQSIVQY